MAASGGASGSDCHLNRLTDKRAGRVADATSASVLRRVAAAIGNQEAPMRYMLGERYLTAMGKLAESANAKTIVLPADIQESMRGIFGRGKE